MTRAGSLTRLRWLGTQGVASDGPGLITAREGRNAQRLLDALLASRGEWRDVDYA